MESVKKLKLRELVPFEGSNNCQTPMEYLELYFNAKCPKTILKNGEIQCLGGKNRSFRDLYYLTRAKFPKVQRWEVSYILKELAIQDICNILNCPHVKKVVFASTQKIKYPFCFPVINGNIDVSVQSYDNADGSKVYSKDRLSAHKILLMAIKYEEKLNKKNKLV